MAKDSDESEHIYEQVIDPPQLAPSGVFKTKGKTVLKPIAFKPVLNCFDLSPGFESPQIICKKLSQSEYSLSQHSFFLEDDNWYSDKLAETPFTESPTDSGVVEAILREKDSQITYLRETLEHNEQVIFKVYEEKEESWRREFRKLRSIYEMKLRISEQKVAKAEHSSQLQKQQIANDQKMLSQELEREKQSHQKCKQHVKELQKEITIHLSQLEEREWSLCQKIGEISLLKAQLKQSQEEECLRFSELLSKVSFQQNSENESLEKSVIEEKRMDLLSEHNSKLSSQLFNVQKELDRNKQEAEEEKIQFFEEKEKVISYQKQLQLNYIQMLRKNKSLEYRLQQMNASLRKQFNESQC